VNYDTAFGSSCVVVGDFNGDGKLDLAVANPNSANVSVLLGNGDGTFQSAVNYVIGAKPESIAVSDFNRDGKSDPAVANGVDISVVLGHGDGTFGSVVNYSAGVDPVSVAVGDFNGDGKTDLAVANYGSFDPSSATAANSSISVLMGNGDGT